MLLLLSALSVSSADDDCVLVREEPQFTWDLPDSRVVPPRIALEAAAPVGTNYWVRARLDFHGRDVTWEQGPYRGASTLPLDLPSSARIDPEQRRFTSTLHVTIVTMTEDGVAPSQLAGDALPAMYVLLVDTGFEFLTDDEARDLAPNGVASDEIRAMFAAAGIDVDDPAVMLGPEVR